jgi:hypothetical protein
MRRDHDFILLADYKADMDDLSNQAVGVIEGLVRQVSDLKRMVWLLTHAAPGHTIEVRRSDVVRFDPNKAELVQWANERDDTIVVRAEFHKPE